jgi:hypothetical protein
MFWGNMASDWTCKIDLYDGHILMTLKSDWLRGVFFKSIARMMHDYTSFGAARAELLNTLAANTQREADL